MENVKMSAGPFETLEKLYRRMPRYTRATFYSALIMGFAVHMYMFANKLPNHDDTGQLLSSTYGTASGRWLLPLVEKLDGSFSMPWLIGVISILLLAVSACYITSLLRIRSTAGCILAASVVVSFPVVAATFTYMFSADAYFLSLALACFSVYITNKYRYGFIGGAAAVVLSMGIYQSYFGVAAMLMVGVLIFDALDNELPLGRLILKGVKFVLTLLAGIAVYLIIVKLTTRTTELVDYMGISQMGSIQLGDLKTLIRNAYLEYVNFFIRNDEGVHFAFMKYVFMLTGAASAALLIMIAVSKRLKAGRALVTAVLTVLFPLAANIIYVMAPRAGVHILMLYGMTGILIAPVALSDYWNNTENGVRVGRTGTFGAVCSWIIVVSIALTSFGYAVFTNEAYLKIELAYDEAYSYGTRLLSAVEQTDGYEPTMTMVLVGETDTDPVPELDEIQLTGVLDMKSFINSYTFHTFLRRYLGYAGDISLDGWDVSKEYSELDEVKSMPVYPADGSIAIIDGRVVVKIGE